MGARSYLGAPLMAQGRLIGSFVLGTKSPGAFVPEQIDIAREVADQEHFVQTRHGFFPLTGRGGAPLRRGPEIARRGKRRQGREVPDEGAREGRLVHLGHMAALPDIRETRPARVRPRTAPEGTPAGTGRHVGPRQAGTDGKDPHRQAAGGGEEPDEDDFQDELLLGKELQKARRYIKNPHDAPPGVKVQRGKRGGYFYETTGTPSKKKKPPSEPPKKEPAKIDKEDLTKRMGFYLSGLKFHPEGEKIISEVDEYTGVGYAYLNKYIRDDKIGNDAEADEKIKYISTFLKNAPKMEGTVYRGMGFSKFKEDSTKQFNEFLSNLKEGESLELKPFTSTSVDPNIATKFATKGAAHSITFEIKSKSGVYLDGVSQLEDEGEVLFDKDSKFKIKKVDRSDYPAHVHVVLEEIS